MPHKKMRVRNRQREGQEWKDDFWETMVWIPPPTQRHWETTYKIIFVSKNLQHEPRVE